MNKKSYLIIIFALAVLIVAFFLYKNSFRKVVEYNQWVNHTQEVIFTFDTLASDIQSAEITPYSMNNRKNKIVNYYAKGLKDILKDINRLRILTKDNAKQSLRLDSLSAILQKQIPLKDRYLSDSAVFDDFFKIQKLIGSAIADEKYLLAQRKSHLEESTQATSILIIVFVGVSLVVIIGITLSNIFHVMKRKKAELFLGSVLNTSQNGIISLMAIRKDMKIEDFKVVYANNAAQKHTGYNAAEMVGKTILTISPIAYKNGTMDRYKQVCETGIKQEFETHIVQNGSTRWLHLMLDRLNDGVTVTVYEITALKQSEAELQQKIRELETTNNELEQFAYVASHDLQEPLRKIKTFAGLINEQFNEPALSAGKTYISKVIQSANRMSSLITDLLNLTDISKQRQSFRSTDLNQVIRNVLSDFELVIEEKKGKVSVSNLQPIEAIPLQMNQLFYNIINNALKFTKPDSFPEISITAKLISPEEAAPFKLSGECLYQQIMIRDNGIGFDQEYAEKIFVIFQRLNSREQYSGSGIGLALCKKIVQNHHGYIFAESVLNQGATFCIILPLQQPVQTASKTLSSEAVT